MPVINVALDDAILELKAKSVAESVAVKSESVFSEDSFDARDFHERQEANEANNSCV